MNRIFFALSLTIAACSRSSGGSSPAASISSSSADGAAPAAATLDSGPEDLLKTSAQARLRAWNDALDRHDVSALEPLYATSVCLYGRVVARSKAVEAKQKALGPGSTFHQKVVGEAQAQTDSDGAVVLGFVKRSGSGDQLHDIRAKLVMRSETRDGALWIVEETDEASQSAEVRRDACEAAAWREVKAAAPAGSGACEATAAKVVNELPAVKKFMDDAKKAAAGGAHLGGVGPEDDGDSFTVGIGFQNPDRFEGHVFYTVVRKTGELTVAVDGEDVVVPSAGLRAVADACKQ